jgi:hypothetical protein
MLVACESSDRTPYLSERDDGQGQPPGREQAERAAVSYGYTAWVAVHVVRSALICLTARISGLDPAAANSRPPSARAARLDPY